MNARSHALRMLIAGILLRTLGGGAPPPLTTVQDVLYKADGTRFNGIAQITWTSFEGPNATNIPMQAKTVRILDGNLFVTLAPTTNAVPAAYYTVKYNSDGKIQFTEYWAVPLSVNKLRVRDVRLQQPLWPGNGGGNGTGNGGDTGITLPILESDVTGLVENLAQRPVKGPGFGNGRVAVISESGEIEAASGALTDCVRVDGTSGPCGSAGGGGNWTIAFVDAEVPGGAVDGANAVFTLTASPNPAGSLALYRNGLRQKTLTDYNLNGATITFLPAAAPQPGDYLQAQYRVQGSTVPVPVFTDNETPTGAIDGTNPTFYLQGVPSPAASLRVFRAGLLQRPSIDYSVSGNTLTFLGGAIPESGDVLVVSYRQ